MEAASCLVVLSIFPFLTTSFKEKGTLTKEMIIALGAGPMTSAMPVQIRFLSEKNIYARETRKLIPDIKQWTEKIQHHIM